MKSNKNKSNSDYTANRRILAKGCYISNDTRATGLNNNDIIIGPSGSGQDPRLCKAEHTSVQ